MPTDLLARRLQVSGDLSQHVSAEASFTAEQRAAIERRHGDLLLDASAGSGKTRVLVERFVRAVVEDGVDVQAILAITFTEKAAAELTERIRTRLRELGADEQARATEGAFISTIHGFCARILRAHTLSAGIDPLFVVLDEPDARRLADAAFEDALEELARNAPGGVELIAAYGPGALRGATADTYGKLRARGQLHPALPPLPPAPDLEASRLALGDAAARAASELGAIADPATRVAQALERLERCAQVVAVAEPWPGELERLSLPGGNGVALTTAASQEYAEALGRFRQACAYARAERIHGLLDQLLRGFAERYAERKRAVSGLDFEDLELGAHELLASSSGLRQRYRERFVQIMVDELQDTNAVQLELIDLIADRNLFCVGDAQQSIYGFRHADVELFEERSERLAVTGARLSLSENFRSRPEILEVLNKAFASALGDRFRPLVPARRPAGADAPLVELLIADKGADWSSEDALAAPWRLAEARALAVRIAELLDSGASPREIVVLTRATTDLRAYERALEELGVPTYVIGGRGYWGHPQVIDMVSYLRALANPLDEQDLYTVLSSPLVGVSLDALVLLAEAAHGSERDPWWVLQEPEGRLDELADEDRARLRAFVEWFAAERRVVAITPADELIERALERTGYDLTMLAMPGGERRLANVRKLMRLAREYEISYGLDLRGFVELVRVRERGWGGAGARESEAPVEGEALDAVRLMTIHRAKGLEFEIVCVADLGRGPWRVAELMRIGRQGGFGLRLAEPGKGDRQPALDYLALGEEQQRFESEEERRLFYVAMTRARERLILSGAGSRDNLLLGTAPMSWIGPAMVQAEVEPVWVEPEQQPSTAAQPAGLVTTPVPALAPAVARPKEASGPPVSSLSYSALELYRRCGYRFYLQRVLGLPKAPELTRGEPRSAMSAADRGILLHAILEKLDFRRPEIPSPDEVQAEGAAELVELIATFARSETCARLARASDVRREERFAFPLGHVLVTGALDVLATEGPGRLLVVDYKSDRLEGADPAELVERAYGTQRLVYALAGLRAGSREVEVAHVFLEAPERPVAASYSSGDLELLEAELGELAGGLLARRFPVAEVPHRGLCSGCPAEGGLCSWPVEMTRRERPDQLF